MPESQTDVNPAPPRRGAWWPRVALVVGVVAAVTVFYATGQNGRLSRDELVDHLDTYRSYVAENQVFALLVFFGIYVAVTALSLPVAVWLSLLAGALFGRWWDPLESTCRHASLSIL